jgi:glycosyltransferase involved in cell wall biosynthesis
MPRLLIVATVGSMIQDFLLPFAHYYRASGWQVDALASGVSEYEECVSAFDNVFDIKWSRNPADLSGILSGFRRVGKLVAEGDYDIVHVHSPIAGFLVRAALRKRRVRPKVVYTAHGFHFHPEGSAWRNRMFLEIERLAGKWTDALITINGEDYEAAKRLQIVSRDRLRYVPGIGIDLERYSEKAVNDGELFRLRRELLPNDPGCVFLQIAEFTPRKRHADALRAFSLLRGPASLLLAGCGPLQSDMQNRAQDLGIADRVRFLGRRTDVPMLIELSDVVILPSAQEGLPRCIMEAMAMGKPVIGSNIRGTRDLLNNGRGMLFPPGDVSALAVAMNSLMDDPRAGVAIGQAAQQAIADYKIQKVLLCHDEIYEGLLAQFVSPDGPRSHFATASPETAFVDNQVIQ